MTTSKHNNTGNTFEFLKRNAERKVMHDKKTLNEGQQMAQEVQAGDWKSLIEDTSMSA